MCRFALGFYYGTYIRETTEAMKAILPVPIHTCCCVSVKDSLGKARNETTIKKEEG